MNSNATAAAAARPPARASRPDGEAARARLLQSGLQLFAQQGFARTSTRELALHAGVNVASISYYFGDKAGLYRAAFFEPTGAARDDIARLTLPGQSLTQALQVLYASFLEPLMQGDTARLSMKLYWREMLEPTGLCDELVTHGIKPMHDALLGVLCRHFDVAEADDEITRLALCIAGLGLHLHVGHDLIESLAPRLNATAEARARWSEPLVRFALAMIDAEQQRRRATAAPNR